LNPEHRGPEPIFVTIRAFVLLAVLLASHPARGAEWQPSSAVLEKLARGEVVLDTSDDNGELDKADMRVAIQIEASPEHVFRTMTSCEQAMRFVPRIRRCKVLETARDGSWQTVEHEVDGNAYLPHTRYVFRADLERFRRIRCTEVSGDFRENRGVWTFRPVKEATATLVTYTVHIVPRFYAPRWAVRASLKRELPTLMTALRDVAQAPSGAADASSESARQAATG
jgi:ribosome-associated toxin RatA of RatAB toxin-antitoxin module